MLLQYYPSGVHCKDNKGITPYDILLKWKHSSAIKRLLLDIDPDLDKITYLILKYGPIANIYYYIFYSKDGYDDRVAVYSDPSNGDNSRNSCSRSCINALQQWNIHTSNNNDDINSNGNNDNNNNNNNNNNRVVVSSSDDADHDDNYVYRYDTVRTQSSSIEYTIPSSHATNHNNTLNHINNNVVDEEDEEDGYDNDRYYTNNHDDINNKWNGINNHDSIE